MDWEMSIRLDRLLGLSMHDLIQIRFSPKLRLFPLSVCRSENSKTPHHLAEFYMLEVELSFIESITEVCTFIETMTKQVTGDILNACEADIVEALCKKPIALSWLDRPFPIISYNEAISILQFHREHLKFPVCPEYGLAKDHELFLVKHIGGPVFVIDWPTEQKPFYMRQKKNQSNIVRFKCLFSVPITHFASLLG